MSSSQPPSAARILLVEDDVLVREALSEGLRQLGFRVRVANAAAAAQEALQEASFDIVVTDWRMPSDGGRVVAAVQRRDPALPVVVLSADPRPRDLPPAVAQWLVKPVSVAELVRALRQVAG